MKRVIGEVLVAVLAVGAAAEAMQGLWWVSVDVMKEPLDKIFVAAASICYAFFRVSGKEMFRKD